MRRKSLVVTLACASLLGLHAWTQEPAAPPPDAPKRQRPPRPPRPGVSTPGVRREMSSITPDAVFQTDGTPDWQVSSDDAQWVANGPKNTVHRMDPKTNTVAAVIHGRQAALLGVGGRIRKHLGSQLRRQNRIANRHPNESSCRDHYRNAGSERRRYRGESRRSLAGHRRERRAVENRSGDERSGRCSSTVPAGSAGVTYGEGAVWVTSPEAGMLTGIDPKTNSVIHSVAVGPRPRFLTTGAGSVWTLNQGDGTVSRVDAKTGKLLANIEVGVPGTGGEIAFGAGHVWATVFEIPISEIDPATNQRRQAMVRPGRRFDSGRARLRLAFQLAPGQCVEAQSQPTVVSAGIPGATRIGYDRYRFFCLVSAAFVCHTRSMPTRYRVGNARGQISLRVFLRLTLMDVCCGPPPIAG